MEGMNRFFWAIWDKEERMEGAEGGRDAVSSSRLFNTTFA